MCSVNEGTAEQQMDPLPTLRESSLMCSTEPINSKPRGFSWTQFQAPGKAREERAGNTPVALCTANQSQPGTAQPLRLQNRADSSGG